MYPVVAVFVNQLVERQILADEVEKVFILCAAVRHAPNVCRLSRGVLGTGCTADGTILFWATVAACYDNRLAV